MRNERGVAMLIALVVAVLLSLLCLSLTMSSMGEMQVSTEFENHEKALLIADAGYNAEKQRMRGDDLDTLLARTTNVTVYKPDPAVENWAMRNPISPIDARNVDFAHMPTGGTSTPVSGLLTPATGTLVAGGRYFARLTDNDDGDGNRLADLDGTVYLRVIGIYANASAESSSGKNSVAIIEAELHRDTSLQMTSPFSMIGQHVNADFQGQPFLVDGYNHPGHAYDYDKAKHQSPKDDEGLVPFYGMNCLYKTPGTENAQPAVNDIIAALDKVPENVTGIGDSPSVTDGTTALTGDQLNVLDPAYMQGLATKLKAIADIALPGDSTLNTAGYGTYDNPKITYVNGDCNLRGGFEGAGILVVTGDLSGNGSFYFEGLILVLGTGVASFEGSNKVVLGGVLLANFENDDSGVSFGTTSLRLHGNDQFLFSGDAINMAVNMTTMRTLSWREVTPEVEPLMAQVEQ
ncbi:MAG: hypothetical protein ACE15E_19085 [Acidobacteriota bacterium]